MNSEWLITFRSITYAQKAQQRLKEAAIFTTLQRTPKTLSERGCGYCLRLGRGDVVAAVEILRQHKIAYGKVFTITAGGPEERQL